MKKLIIFSLLIFIVKDFQFSVVNAQKPELMLPEGHTDYMYSVCFSPDSKTVLTASGDKTAKIWDLSSGKLLHSFNGHTKDVRSVQFSPDGKYIVTGSYDHSAKIWDAQTGMLLNNLTDGTEEYSYSSAIFSPDGKTIVTSSEPYIARMGATGESASKWDYSKIWDAQSGQMLRIIKGSETIFSPDSKNIATITRDNAIIIWDAERGKQLYKMKGHTDAVFSISFSPDGKKIASASRDKTVKIWDVQTGKLLNTLTGHTDWVRAVNFSPDGKEIVTGSNDKTAKIWDAESGKLLNTLVGHKVEVTSASFSPDGKFILTEDSFYDAIWDAQDGKQLHYFRCYLAAFSPDGDKIATAWDYAIDVWDAHNFALLTRLEGHTINIKALLSPDGKSVLTVSDDRANIWDIKTGKIVQTFHKNSLSRDAVFSPDGKSVASTSKHNVKIWDTQSGKVVQSLEGHSDLIWSFSFSSDGKKIASASDDKTAKIWDVQTGKLIHSFKHSNGVVSAYFSPDGKYLATDSNDTTYIWDTETGHQLSKWAIEGYTIPSSFSPDSKNLVSPEFGDVATIMNVTDGSVLFSLDQMNKNSSYWETTKTFKIRESWRETDLAGYSPDGKHIMTMSRDGTTELWDPESTELLHKLNEPSDMIWSPVFSPDSKSLVTVSNKKYADLWDSKSGLLLKSVDLHFGELSDILWSDSILISVYNAKISLLDLKTGKELLSWIAIDSTDWVVLHPSGLFDASPGAMEKMYYVLGGEIIELNQLKERYYEPGLWQKTMETGAEPLRDVKGFDEIKLTPAIHLAISNDVLDINLVDRGGGIGKYVVYINGKEAFEGNIPEGETKFRGGTKLESNFNLKNHPYLLPGSDNDIEVKAYNGENYIISRGEKITYHQGGINQTEKPRLFIISSGISDYTGDLLDLKYAAKDAEDITRALTVGAKNLFGAEETFVFKETTNDSDKKNWPTKENIKKAFAEVSKMTKSSDILVVYLSGHGMNFGGQEGDFYYLTQDAYSGSAEVYSDPVIKGKTTLSSAELTELIKSVPALKEVLIIDACSSGKAVENLMAKREISSSTLRALDRMKDRIGLHIITGCAADAVSYEASRYGQGLLTYSLLEGIKGASLREEKFVDVAKLFQYCAERVPQLAVGIGGIQQPQVFSPYGESSFDIGEILSGDKTSIPLAIAKPMFLMSSLKDKESFDDNLGIEKLVDDKLRDVSSKSASSPIIFIEAKEYPEAYRIRGAYSIINDQLEISVNVFRGTEKTGSFTVKGKKTDTAAIAEEIVEKAQESAR